MPRFFFIFLSFFLMFFFIIAVITYQLLPLLIIFFRAKYVHFDFFFPGDLTLLELGIDFPVFWTIVNFAFCFFSSWRTDCPIIICTVSGFSYVVRPASAVSFSKFGRAIRKQSLYKLKCKEHWYPLICIVASVSLKILYR